MPQRVFSFTRNTGRMDDPACQGQPDSAIRCVAILGMFWQ